MSGLELSVDILRAIVEGPEGMKQEVAAIAGVDASGGLVLEPMAFQWWPETLTDSLSGGWQTKQMPGGSHALVHWGGNGERTISFEVLLTRQMMDPADRPLTTGIKDLLIDPYSEFPYGLRKNNVQVEKMVAYFRSFMYPEYSSEGKAKAPPIAALYFPNTNLNETGSDVLWTVMTGCEVTYHKWFPSGRPRVASLALTFVQTVQSEAGVNWRSQTKPRDLFGPGGTINGGFASSRGRP